MYQVGGWLDLVRANGSTRSVTAARRVVSANVIVLGLTSLLTDVSTEMVASVLPIYLIGFLHLSPAQFGILDGLYHGTSALVQVASGMASDRLQRYKAIAGLGYALSALSRLGLLFTSALTGITALLAVDRIGKGIRTGPRDALISLSASTPNLGLAFGVHRAMDATGAMLGPMVAFVLIQAIPGRFDVVIVASLAAAVVGLAVFGFFVDGSPSTLHRTADQPRASVHIARCLIGDSRFRHLAVTSILLGILTISDAFVYLNLQRQGHVTAGAFPLLFVFTSACYLVAAIPVGRLADRFGAFATFIAGHAALIILYACLLAAMPGGWLVAFTVMLLGLYYAATDGVLMALGSQLLSGEVRTTGLAVLTTGHASSRLVSSIVFGALWQQAGLRSTMTVFIVGLVLAIAAVLVMRPRSRR